MQNFGRDFLVLCVQDERWAAEVLEGTPAGDWAGLWDLMNGGPRAQKEVAVKLAGVFSTVGIRRKALVGHAERVAGAAAAVVRGDLVEVREAGAHVARLADAATRLEEARAEALGLAFAWSALVDE